MKSYFTFILITFLSVQSCTSQDGKFTGYATAVVNEDEVLEIEAFGLADKEKKKNYSKNTIQPIGSVSKTVIGVSLMIAKEKGLIDLDKDINEYLDFKIVNPHIDDSNIITLRHLATHTSGIMDNEKIYESAYAYELSPKISLRAYLYEHLNHNRKSVKKSFLKKKAGVQYEYSNIGAALAAYIIEKISAKPFNEFTKENIFTPLKMNNTGWFYENINSAQHSILYDEKDQVIQPYSCVTYPDGSLKTNIQDISLYLIELIKGYNGNSTLLTKKSWSELYAKNFNENNEVQNINPREPNTGLFMAYFKSGKIGHTGSDLGASAFMMFNPKTNVGQILMANEDLSSDNLERFKKIWNKLSK
ncbi:CubicO group peptidase (beta-lactamase class C family) [Aquimarina sp. MAR_2010_214]|uniref:serine hydrolase domain-containing protein n=1 Tax=Aquimarina sp. MAR_2010_214 TaxID=1250026 RepID=UPI000C71535F|nr:serine hydrolase domain-containing protein [Aquimarina sp. MAR_2010_214]PKV52751.1 CubicO group peptidase (beta-lactamase class C family) [Aquimarina sp. MAR_2010_214]